VRLLLDTHIILWATLTPEILPSEFRALLEDDANQLVFSAANIWEVAIKQGRAGFDVDSRVLRRALRESDYTELAITSEHAAAVASLPPIHWDPFDRILISQALVENLVLVTSDPVVARYPVPVRYAARR
jgi:PIN domain nuclease of toxin-antitoxin system